ncbi:hypothetical protein [Klebsiella pneumoniae]|uniref:hypothetical protein n=1 Tax=Klebsiella pneumoniae TaxID=573 RepID=UPI002961FFC2|nr:hypothetical protein [Klebsiella pneumoniae]MDW1257525.1 hypothetical protein [Klebsiella pneumoniae]
MLAQNIDGHVIDLGELTKQNGTINWLLDGNKEKGENLKTEIEALEDIASKIDFLFLDGQFTSLPDISAEYKNKLTSAPSMEIVLNEPGDKPQESPTSGS